jgi:hypothetical protein
MEQSSASFASFPEEVQEAIDGLLYLGHIEKEIEWCGHKFVVRTLKTNDELQVAALSKEYLETFGQVLAYAAAVVALSLVSVDGDDAFCVELGPSDKAYARNRFAFVCEWYRPTIETLFAACEELRDLQAKAVEALKDLSSGSRRNYWPSPDSLNVPGDFLSPTEDIQELLTD